MSSNPKETKVIPIIIKRVVSKKNTAGGGDSWKIAYADFITAMMAFFMLLWLLNSVPSQKLKGIAAYFEPTFGMLGHNNTKVDKDDNNKKEEEADSAETKTKGFVYGVKETGDTLTISSDINHTDDIESENNRLSLFQESIKKDIDNNKDLKKLEGSVEIKQTNEGLEIQLTDQEDVNLFKPGTAILEPYTKVFLIKIADLIKYTPNFIAVSGYTEKMPDDLLENYGKWELSSNRANAVRRFIVLNGVAPEKIAKLRAYADANPLVPGNPYDPKNNRITIILLRQSQMPIYKLSTTRDLISFGDK